MTTPLVVTDEMRRAVLQELCDRTGHAPDVSTLMRPVNGKLTVTGPDDTSLPYLRCVRCGRVWLVVETGALNYEDAEAGALTQLAPETPFRHRIQQLRDARAAQAG